MTNLTTRIKAAWAALCGNDQPTPPQLKEMQMALHDDIANLGTLIENTIAGALTKEHDAEGAEAALQAQVTSLQDQVTQLTSERDAAQSELASAQAAVNDLTAKLQPAPAPEPQPAQ
ncbi:MAG: hypothetical protein KGP14_10555 [Betaproteobacteria bacterium]|nr:hypothetical protein [Betaproteobacteria bacterium]